MVSHEGVKEEGVETNLGFDLMDEFWGDEGNLPELGDELWYDLDGKDFGTQELDAELSNDGKYSDSSLSDHVESCSSTAENKPNTPAAGEKKRKLEEVSPQNNYVVELERRLDILAKENRDLRKQLALLKQSNRSLRSQVQPVMYSQQPFLVTFANNIQGALTVTGASRAKSTTGVTTLCFFFLMGAFVLPGMFSGDLNGGALPMLPNKEPPTMALPDYVTERQDNHTFSELRSYGRDLLALPMTETERRDRDAVFMCPKVVSILRDDRDGLEVISVVVPSASLTNGDANSPYTELVCEVREVNPMIMGDRTPHPVLKAPESAETVQSVW